MRALVLPVAVLLLALAVGPLAEARYVASGQSPWRAGHPLNPQLYCAVLFDEPGDEFCKVQGSVIGAEIVRVRIAGTGSVHVSVKDDRGPLGEPEQRAVVDCNKTCLAHIPYAPFDDDAWTMYVWMDAPGPAAFIEVSIEGRARVTESQEI